ncbi:TIGR03617 family F420-dependent LLM class oxidoreductase [uncultured Jatrophihabitans sp.]|uniref:TIGR03617 family F420-dependent LLM class oxidoreductase n=1 Tax=uncultured Jatrophihabitans sp. TaxID=1610747 RepID=UPI0035C9EF27
MTAPGQLTLDRTLDGVGLAEVGEVARRAEDDGAGGLWLSEIGNDPFLPLAPAALATARVELGTSVAIAFARTPMTVAMTAHELQRASRGRFVLGLGTQVRAHVTRRFGMPWSQPAARMADFVQALHAIWDAWNGGGPLEHNGPFYQHTLMPPMFRPPAHDFGRPKVLIAGVGPRLVRVGSEVGDGVFVHAFASPLYYREVIEATVRDGLAASGRGRAEITVAGAQLVATGPDGRAIDAAAQAARRQVAFYASTPAYAGVLAAHGWDDLQPRLAALVRDGRWDELDSLVSDEVLQAFVLVGPPAEVGAQLRERWLGMVDRVCLVAPGGVSDADWRAVHAGLHAAQQTELHTEMRTEMHTEARAEARA